MKQLRIHYFQHVAFEDLGYIEIWAKENNHLLTVTKFYENHQLPELAEIDWLIVLGGPMSVYENNKFPWLKDEIEFIQKAIQANKTVIGICLGAQIIASALGANVYPNIKKEIGWFPLNKTEAGQKQYLLKDLPDTFTTFHWHGDTFDLPKDAIHLLQSDICSNQAFLYKKNVLGLQFHLEAISQTINSMTKNCKHELVKDDYIQTIDEIVNQTEFFISSNKYLESILNKLSVEEVN